MFSGQRLYSTNIFAPGHKGGARRARLFKDDEGRYYKTRWPKGWRPRRGSSRIGINEPKDPWHRSSFRRDRRWGVFWYSEGSRCSACKETRYVFRCLRMFTALRYPNSARWVVRSRRVQPSSSGIRAAEYGSPPEILCKCLRLRLPKNLDLSLSIT